MLTEQRETARKVLKVKAQLALEDAPPQQARTMDVGANGMCITSPNPVRVGSTGTVSFELYFDGNGSTITVRAKALYCIFSHGEYKIGFQFLNLDLSAMSVLAKYLR
ncbi:MAG: PilZ domain-containing protein [Pseudomonadota bacterium]